MFSEILEDLGSVIRAAKEGHYKLILAQNYYQKMLMDRSIDRNAVKWEKPKEGFVKINWDVAVNVQLDKIGVGVVIRDHEGEVLACLSASVDLIRKPVVIEALALRRVSSFVF